MSPSPVSAGAPMERAQEPLPRNRSKPMRRFGQTTGRSLPPLSRRWGGPARGRRRWLAALAALAFGFGLTADAHGLHPCPHHQGEGGHHPGTEHVEQSAHGDVAPSEAPDAPHHDEGPCACLGDCAGAGAPSEPTADLGRAPAPTSGGGPAEGPAEHLPHRIHLPHILPYPLGPPPNASL